MTHPLDNVIWRALTTRQAKFAEAGDYARRFPTDITSLAAVSSLTAEGYESLASLPSAKTPSALFLESPQEPPREWRVIESTPLLQMACENGVRQTKKLDFIELTAADAPEMLALARLTKPGPFGLRTHELGDYIGIRNSGKLVAMAGERLRIPGYTEVSAVCTHPDYLGHGYATALMAILMERIHHRGEIPFLHVRPGNLRAVELYKRLGFRDRRLLHLSVIQNCTD